MTAQVFPKHWDFKKIDEVLFGLRGNSYNRFDIFLNIAPQLNGKYYWYALGGAYTGADITHSDKDDIRAAFSRNEPERNYLMSDKEQDFFKNLPQKLVLYRGMTIQEYQNGDFGVSWTLKRKTAESFAFTYRRFYDINQLPKMVHKIEIDKGEAIAYFNDEREENEIIYMAH